MSVSFRSVRPSWCAVVGLLLLVPALLTAQPAPGAEEGAPGRDERLQLAIANREYPVTPGDVYLLTFLQGDQQVVRRVVVESSYRLNLGVFGEVNARGMTFADLKPEVEKIIAEAYPRSLPSLSIASLGLFQVTLAGAIPQTRRMTAWGLSRLTGLIDGNTAPFTSLREVVVRSASGSTRTYDVFRAIHAGDESQDPLLRPGDTVTFRRRETTVTVEGEVYEPGDYELLPGEGLMDLEDFFQGYHPRADTKRLVVDRPGDELLRQISVGSPEQAGGFDFRDGDILIVPARTVSRPVVYLEGAVSIDFQVEPQEDVDSALPVYNRVSVPLTTGDTLYRLLVEAQDGISPFADLEGGYIVRRNADFPVRVNLRKVLHRETEYSDFELQPFDRIVIPLEPPFVVVNGGVTSPGRYPYNPFESYAYYLGLAGIGSDSLADVAGLVQIYDRDGKPAPADAAIEPGFTIHVPPFPGEPDAAAVLVTGAVAVPGLYELVRGATAQYYIQQAGGIDDEVSADGSFTVENADGETRPADSIIAAGDTIKVARNGFVYNFNRYFPVVTTAFTFITTIITIVNALNP